MGSGIFHGAQGTCRVLILLLLVISLIFTSMRAFSSTNNERDESINLHLEGFWVFDILVLASLIIWYILLVVDTFAYGNTVRWVDGVLHVVLGLTVEILGVFASGRLHNTFGFCPSHECWLYYIGQIICVAVGILMAILGLAVILRKREQLDDAD